MKALIVAALVLLAACATSDRPAETQNAADALESEIDRGHSRVGFISEPGASDPEDAADLAGIAAIVDLPRDPAFPARNRQLVIPSGPIRPELGRPAEMNALFLQAAGEGLKPTLLLLHGLPGNERNLDLAQAVRRGGWNVLTFTYRGAWGSEGLFSIRHAIEDAGAALAFLRSARAARFYGVDFECIVIAGHSMGGMAAAIVAAEDSEAADRAERGRDNCAVRPPGPPRTVSAVPPLAGLVLLDAWNAGATAQMVRAAGEPGRAAFVAQLDDLGRSLGPVTAADLADELIRSGEAWELTALAPRLARTPVLSVFASEGLAADNRALAEALRRPPGARVGAVEIETDHAFADRRIALAMRVLGWLQALRTAP